MDDNHKSNGFLWGFLIGSSLTALVGTKKGRAFLKELSEVAAEIFQDFLEKKNIDIKDIVNMQEDEQEAAVSMDDREDENKNENTHSQNDSPKPLKKRLFKGVRK